MSKIICVGGTDTDIGKTFVSLALIRLFTSQGKRTAYYKPFQSGAIENEGSLILPDIDFIKKHSGLNATDIHALYALAPPLSPYHAAKELGVSLSQEEAVSKTKHLASSYDVLIVEGSGGLYVPITEDYLMIDYFKDIGGLVVLASRIGLGTINHTLLSAEACVKNGLDLRAVILNRIHKEEGLADSYNIEYLSNQIAPLPLTVLPHLSDEDLSRQADFISPLSEVALTL